MNWLDIIAISPNWKIDADRQQPVVDVAQGDSIYIPTPLYNQETNDGYIEDTDIEERLEKNKVNWNNYGDQHNYKGRAKSNFGARIYHVTEALMRIIIEVGMSMIMIFGLEVDIPYFYGNLRIEEFID